MNKTDGLYDKRYKGGGVRMKRVIVAVQNALVSEAVAHSFKKCDMLVEKTQSDTPDGIAAVCEALFADVLFMDVTRFGGGNFDNRMKTVDMVKKNDSEIKICLVCDNVSDPELAFKVSNAKNMGVIDAFFYQSVPSDYIADVINTIQ